MQLRGAAQLMSTKASEPAMGERPGLTVQYKPSHSSISTWGVRPSGPVPDPTNMHDLGDAHATALASVRALSEETPLGTDRIVQDVPFQRSANARVTPFILVLPTAMHIVADGHEMSS